MNKEESETDNNAEENLKKIEDILGITQYNSINSLINLKKFDIAEKEIEKLLKEDPNDYDALVLRGYCYFERGKLGSAIKVLEQAISVEPNDDRAHRLLGEILCRGLDIDRGISEYEEALRLDPDDPRNKAALAHYLFLYNKHDKDKRKRAETLIRDAKKNDPEDSFVKSVYHIINRSKSTEIIDDLQDENINENNLTVLGNRYLKEGEYKKAQDVLGDAVRIDPTEPIITENYILAVKSNMLFYKPMMLVNRFSAEHGVLKFYAVWYGTLIVIGMFFPPALLLFVVFAIYTWIANPIAGFFAKRKIKKGIL